MQIHQYFILQGYFCVTKTAAKVLFFFDICKYFQIILCFACIFFVLCPDMSHILYQNLQIFCKIIDKFVYSRFFLYLCSRFGCIWET